MTAPTRTPHPQAPAHGASVLGHCVVERPLWRDRLASVFLAHARHAPSEHCQLWSVHADQVTCSEQATTVFSEEMERIRTVEHPSIPKLLAYDAEESAPVVLTRHAEGKSLRELITSRGWLFPNEAVRVLTAVASALEALHACMPPILHRRVCPERILVREKDGKVWLEQCGFLHALVAAGMISDKAAAGVAPPGYHVPEELVQAPTPETDTFALAVVAFEALTGQLPFGTASSGELSQTLRGAPRPSACALRATLPAEVDEVFEHAWTAHTDSSRHATPASFLRDLSRALGIRTSERPTMPNVTDDNPPEEKSGDAPVRTGEAPSATPATSTAEEVERAFDSMLAEVPSRAPSQRTGEYGAVSTDVSTAQGKALTPEERKAVLGVISEKPTLLGTPVGPSTPPPPQPHEDAARHHLAAPRADRQKTGPRGVKPVTGPHEKHDRPAEKHDAHPPLGTQGELSGVTKSSVEKAADLTLDAVLDENSNVGKGPAAAPNATVQMDDALVESLRQSEEARGNATKTAPPKEVRSGGFRAAVRRAPDGSDLPPPPAAGTRPSARPPTPSARPRPQSAPPRPVTGPQKPVPVRTPSVPFPSAVRKVLATAPPASATSTATSSAMSSPLSATGSSSPATTSSSPSATTSASESRTVSGTSASTSAHAITTPYPTAKTKSLADSDAPESLTPILTPTGENHIKVLAAAAIPPPPRMPGDDDTSSGGSRIDPPADLASESSSPTLSIGDVRSVSDVVTPEVPIGEAPTLTANSLVVPKLRPDDAQSEDNDKTPALGRSLAVDSQEETLEMRPGHAKVAVQHAEPPGSREASSAKIPPPPPSATRAATPVPPPKHPTPVSLPKHPTPVSVTSRSAVRAMPTPVPRSTQSPPAEASSAAAFAPPAPPPETISGGGPMPEMTPWMQVARFVGTLTFLSSVIVAGVLIYGLRIAENLLHDARQMQRRAAVEANTPDATPSMPTVAPEVDASSATVAPVAEDVARFATTPDIPPVPPVVVSVPDAGTPAVTAMRDAAPATTTDVTTATDAVAYGDGSVPGEDERLRLANLIRPGLNDCIEGAQSARPVVMTVRFDGATGTVAHIRLHGIFDEPPLGPCIEAHVTRVGRTAPFAAPVWEPTFVFSVPPPRWRPPPPH